jgi:hypothetical protein
VRKLKVGFRGAFFWLLFWASKKVTERKQKPLAFAKAGRQ